MPKALPQHANLELAGEWRQARAIGGDYFDVVQLDADRYGICIGDVAGKGLTASLLMANLQAAFRAYATAEASPAEVCSKLNAFECGNVATGKFITFFYAILDAKRRVLQYENAGHCPALLLHAEGEPEFLRGQGGVLGILPEWTEARQWLRVTGCCCLPTELRKRAMGMEWSSEQSALWRRPGARMFRRRKRSGE